jgi:exosortase/archaeosortase family protein
MNAFAPMASPRLVPMTSPALAWLALHAAALWPHGRWVWARAVDGSDGPLGLVAIVALVALLLHHRKSLRLTPNLPWLVAAAMWMVVATAAWMVTALTSVTVPPLAAALAAALSLGCGVAAWAPHTMARTPLAGLALLALPLVASLQFYVGYPLRLITAELSAWALQAVGLDAVRSGASMTVRGQLVIVDAPCSGVQMVWMAYFTACLVAAWWSLRDSTFLRRLPLVSVLVLLGNAARNSVLVALESRSEGLSSAAHEAIGLVALGAVLATVVLWMKRETACIAP